uniref:Uncharacterized protein n=1 Tax=Ditylenchus dipsaci TaxID=166011 RepID=A0A915D7C4_9BILA
MNYLRCDDRPIVFTDLDEQEEKLVYNFTTKKIKFEPAKLCMFPNGRLYHSAHFDNYGLVKSKLADRLFPRFRFSSEGNPTHFYWKDEWIELDNEFLKYAVQK